MEPNQNPPSEREWTIEEREEFFASQDAVTGLLGGGIATNWSHGEVLPPITMSDLLEAYAQVETTLFRGIHVTKIVAPEQGWPVSMYCPICKETTFMLSPWAVKPEKGDYWRMNEVCASDAKHNMRMAMKPIAYRPLPGGYVDATGPHRGVPPSEDDQVRISGSLYHRLLFGPYDAEFTQEMSVEEAKRRYPDTPIPGEEK